MNPGDPTTTPNVPGNHGTGRRFRAWLVALIALGGVASLIVVWRAWNPGQGENPDLPPSVSDFPPDPRLAYTGPYHNVRPGVASVGDAQCAACHAEIAKSYSRHPMGRSITPIAEIAGSQSYDASRHNPFEAFDTRFVVDRVGDRVFHRQTRLDKEGKPVYEFHHEADFAIGSGARGHSYLNVRDGFVLQTPVSWFSQKQIWDLSPGFPPWARAGRPVQGACLYCHANQVEPVEHTRNQYHEPVFRGHAIGCERCHGPGGLHAESSAKNDIVNPAKLDDSLRDAVCQQCHLEGEARVPRLGSGLNDYRPGMPLEDFLSVFVKSRHAGSQIRAVNHVEQMHESQCYIKGKPGSRLGCVSCHNPHEAVPEAKRVSHYRAACMKCHQEKDCAEPRAARLARQSDDSCFACHMPRSATTDIVHTASTTHRIVGKSKPPVPEGKSSMVGALPLVDFHRGVPDLRDTRTARELGIALSQAAQREGKMTGKDGEFILGLLNRAVREHPGDVAAREAAAKTMQTLKQTDAAIEAYEAILKIAPRHENSLVSLGTLNRDLGRTSAAREYWIRATDVNPKAAEYRRNLTNTLAALDLWEETRRECVRWMELDPSSVEARQILVSCLLHDGEATAARAEFEKIRRLRPSNLDRLEAWYQSRTR